MFNWILRNVLGKIAAVSVRRRLAAFEEATQRPQRIQDELLRRILLGQASTAFGKDHLFSTIRTLSDFRKVVPVRDYDYIEPYMQRVLKRETNALLTDKKIPMFALTSGPTAPRQHRPVPDTYLPDS